MPSAPLPLMCVFKVSLGCLKQVSPLLEWPWLCIPFRVHRVLLYPSEPTITRGSQGSMNGKMPRAAQRFLLLWRMLLPSFLSYFLDGTDSNNDNSFNDSSALLNTGYYVSSTILSVLHVIHLIPITTL